MQLEIPDEYFTDEELKNTPQRFKRFLDEWLKKSNDYNFTVFDNNENYKEIIMLKSKSYSICSHHLLPFILDPVYIAYIPDKKICGLSKIQRLLDSLAHRPQIQERLTDQIVKKMNEKLQPKGVMCVMYGRHFCMEMRGVKTKGDMMTSALCGVFEKPPPGLNPREELLQLIKNDKS